MRPAQLLVALPETCNTPDGMALMPDQSVIVSVPNFNDMSKPPLLVKISPQNEVSIFHDRLPVAAKTGKSAPMGIACGPSGDLYLADMQYFFATNKNEVLTHTSRILRIAVKDGKPAGVTVVASGLNVANGVAVHGGHVYVTESVLDHKSDPLLSGVMRFELNKKEVVLTQPLEKDPHLIATFKTYSKDFRFGADGLAFDSKGNLFVGMFGDGVMYKIEFDAKGAVVSNRLFAKSPIMKCCDGMSCDPRTDKLYVADSVMNAIQVVSPDGSVRTLARNGDVVDKRSGRMDQPCEALVRGDTIVVSNMDWPFPKMVNTKYQMPATLSFIPLK